MAPKTRCITHIWSVLVHNQSVIQKCVRVKLTEHQCSGPFQALGIHFTREYSRPSMILFLCRPGGLLWAPGGSPGRHRHLCEAGDEDGGREAHEGDDGLLQEVHLAHQHVGGLRTRRDLLHEVHVDLECSQSSDSIANEAVERREAKVRAARGGFHWGMRSRNAAIILPIAIVSLFGVILHVSLGRHVHF